MHYYAEIYLKELDNVEEQIAGILSPYSEHNEVEQIEEDGETYWHNPIAFFDWYQIGGRWTGEHTGYDPSEDVENVKTCDLCKGSGFRRDLVGLKAAMEHTSYTCNGCGTFDRETKKWIHGPYGKGRRLVWPTQFAKYKKDIIDIKDPDLKSDLSSYTLIVGPEVFHKEEWNGSTFEKTKFDGNVLKKLAELKINTGYLVTIDYHS